MKTFYTVPLRGNIYILIIVEIITFLNKEEKVHRIKNNNLFMTEVTTLYVSIVISK